MNVTFLFRAHGRFSIERVFDTIEEELKGYNVNIKKIYMPYYRVTLKSILRNILYARKNSKGIIQITGAIDYVILGVNKRKTVLTVHDFRLNHEKKVVKKFFYSLLWHYIPFKLASVITCISEKTKTDICEKYPWAGKKIKVIYNPYNRQYVQSNKTFNIENPTVLHVGTLENKNLPRVIEALNGIKCSLRIIGDLSKEQVEMLEEYGINYTNAVSISNEQMVEEYKNCDVVSFPSLYEGFGMPIIEGQATGRIVVTSCLAPMDEIGADSVIYVDPTDVKSIRVGFETAIYNKEERERLIIKGYKNVERFTAENVASQYLQIYQELERGRMKFSI